MRTLQPRSKGKLHSKTKIYDRFPSIKSNCEAPPPPPLIPDVKNVKKKRRQSSRQAHTHAHTKRPLRAPGCDVQPVQGNWFSDFTWCIQQLQLQWRRQTNFTAPGCKWCRLTFPQNLVTVEVWYFRQSQMLTAYISAWLTQFLLELQRFEYFLIDFSYQILIDSSINLMIHLMINGGG